MGGEKREQRVWGIFWNVADLKNETDFWEFLGNFEIIGLLETWIDEKEWGKLKEKMPKEWRWKCQPADRDKRRGRAKGGIITGIRKEIEENKEELESREGIQERKIILNGEKWRVVTIYNREGRKKGLEDLQEVIKEEEKRKMVMVGDFNARIGKEGGVRTLSGEEKRPEEGKRVSKDKVINKQGKELLRVIMILNGEKVGDEGGEWTYERTGGRSVIDYGIANWEAWEKIDRFEIGCRIESDHQPIIIDFGGRYARKEEVADEVGRIQDWSEEGINIYKEKIEKIEWKGEDVQEGWEELESEINSAVVWKRTGKRKGLGGSPWWDRECREKKREVNKVRKRYREGEERWENFIRCRREYREACRVKEELHKKREEEEIENIRTESQAWNFINKGRKKREGIMRGEKVRGSRLCRLCVDYKRVNDLRAPEYIRKIKRNEGKKLQMNARWRCGNEVRGNRYWQSEEDKRCRLCEREKEEIDHLKEKCVYVEKKVGRNFDVLNEDGRGHEWMKMIEKVRQDREREREGG
ncbi:hypothetical protein ALC62_05571 [Cyphomyrmex costatus]|uniref:Endonuclease/exonuclease/phosphatase domain-containing protein n=1 Tax=Cyphomyrmex costatus TaxID=456900 RepID=A0A151IJM5_9HYME|nr:hypothetical protein ALC62_05571 [Cyphomyrmex costatus]